MKGSGKVRLRVTRKCVALVLEASIIQIHSIVTKGHKIRRTESHSPSSGSLNAIEFLSKLVNRVHSKISLTLASALYRQTSWLSTHLRKYAAKSSLRHIDKLHSRPCMAIFLPKSSCAPSPFGSPLKKRRVSYKSDRSIWTGT